MKGTGSDFRGNVDLEDSFNFCEKIGCEDDEDFEG